MRITTTLVLAGAILALSGCQTVEVTKSLGRPIPTMKGTSFPTVSTRRCHRGNCDLKITVVDCRAGTFDIDGSILTLGGAGGGRQRVIVWIIQDSGYEFASDPRVALDPKESEAFFGRPTVSGPVLVAKVRVEAPGQSHEYGLSIVKSDDGTRCGKFDPWVVE